MPLEVNVLALLKGQERYVFVGGADEPGEDLHRLLELLAELLVLLVAPGIGESVKLSMDGGQAGLQIAGEALQVVGEAAQFLPTLSSGQAVLVGVDLPMPLTLQMRPPACPPDSFQG